MGFTLRNKGELSYLVIPSFEDSALVRHGFSTRLGGVSKGPLTSLNLGIKKADKPGAVFENFVRFCDALDIDIRNLVSTDQVHGTSIHIASGPDKGKGIFLDSDITEKDAMITRERNVALVIFFADCVPLLFIDTKTPAIGAAHAGWRGTADGIGPKVLARMAKEYGTKPENILAGIGPCINQCCYEIDEPVAAQFRNTFDFGLDILQPVKPGHWKLDLVSANKLQLKKAGVLPGNIVDSGYCTSCNNDMFFSHRADLRNTGSLAAIIELK